MYQYLRQVIRDFKNFSMVDSLCTQNDSLLTYSLKGLVLSGLLLPRFVQFHLATILMMPERTPFLWSNIPTLLCSVLPHFQSTRFRGKNKPTQAFLLLKANPFPFKKISSVSLKYYALKQSIERLF